ncbi:iron-sulfur cluster assembly protein [Nocardioides sp. NPDC004968]|uniref:iron-sulfur cluster assembly protein n=1 Tax=Nocardioides sp. NPDC004968 TaxID=3155894 RepID=UPI0033AB7B0D
MSLLTQESTRAAEAYAALHAVVDPELDEPITDLGFVRSLTVSPTAPDGETVSVEVHLRLPTSFCSPNFAYLMASDAKDALTALPWTDQVVVELDIRSPRSSPGSANYCWCDSRLGRSRSPCR